MTRPIGTAPSAATVRHRPAPPGRPVRAGRQAHGGAQHRLFRGRPYLLYLIPSALLFLGVIAVPFVMNIGISLTRWSGVGPLKWVGLANYRQLIGDSQFWAAFWHSAALIVAMAIIPAFIGLVLAAALVDLIAGKFGPRTASVLRACIYLPQVLPIVVAGIVWGWILDPQSGALNRLLSDLGLGWLAKDWLGDPRYALLTVMGVLVWIQVGYPVVMFMAGLQRVDPQLAEAAEIDGASWWRRLWRITVPQIRPEIYVVLLTCTIAALKVFALIFVLTQGGPGTATQVPSYFSYQNFFQYAQVGYGAAIATVLTVIIIVLSTLFLRVQHAGQTREGRSW
jgi:raffinose/stachyose/melibiose transport system permease protein